MNSKESHFKVYKDVALRKTNVWKFGILETQVLGNGNAFWFTRLVFRISKLAAVVNF